MSENLLSILGGLLIGLGASLLLLSTGKVAGVSGISSGILQNKHGDRAWRYIFIFGLICSSLIWILIWPERFESIQNPEVLRLVISGVMVGFGTRLARGCTSGHGICGMARGSRASIVATCVFIMTAVLTVFFIRKFYGA